MPIRAAPQTIYVRLMRALTPQQKERAIQEEAGMSEVELRLNAHILKRVVDNQAGVGAKVPAQIKDKVAYTEQQIKSTPRTHAQRVS